MIDATNPVHNDALCAGHSSGDPLNTLEYMESLMCMKNNFYANNITMSGSSEVTVVGNMSAGNQILIDRDLGDDHAKLTVDRDGCISDGSSSLPGRPEAAGGTGGYALASWRELPVN